MATEHQKQYYRKQREQAESAADKGDRSAAGTAKKINAKLGKTDKAKHYADVQQFGKTGAKVASGIDRASSAAGNIAGFIEGGPAKSIAGTVAKEGARMFPRAAEGLSGLIKNLSGQAVKRGVQGARKAAGSVGKAAKSVATKAKSALIKSPGKAQKIGNTATKAAAGPAATNTGKRVLKSISTKGKVARTSPSKTSPMSGAVKSKPTGQSNRTLKPGTKKLQRFVDRQGSKDNPPKSSVSRAKKTRKKTES